MNELNKTWETLIDDNYFTEEGLQLVTDVAGYNMETLNNCIYSRYGYENLQQLQENL